MVVCGCDWNPAQALDTGTGDWSKERAYNWPKPYRLDHIFYGRDFLHQMVLNMALAHNMHVHATKPPASAVRHTLKGHILQTGE
jgi:hypothetical protein